MKILLTGGSGLLGKELQKHIVCEAPSHEELDITKIIDWPNKYDLIIHAAAYTDVAGAEREPSDCLDANVFGTLNLLKAFRDTPFVLISSEYAKDPINFYSKTKALAEELVERYGAGYEGISTLIIRTLFKPTPFPFPEAFADQYTQGDYVDVIAPLIAKKIKAWDRVHSNLTYVGTGRKTMYDLAKRTRPDIKKNYVADIKNVKIPKDYA